MTTQTFKSEKKATEIDIRNRRLERRFEYLANLVNIKVHNMRAGRKP